MKKKWMAVSCAVVFLSAASTALWLGKPMITASLANTVETTINSKLNGTLHFSGLDISLSGKVVLENPVIVDTTGRKVLEGKELEVFINPVRALQIVAGSSAVEAIDSITVDVPTLYVWQNSDQAWNVATLVKTNDGESRNEFKSPVRIQKGTIEATLPDGTIVRGENCQGTVNFTKYPVIDFDGEGQIDGKKFSVSGSYTSERQYRAVINSEGMHAAYGNAFLPESVGGTIQGGDVQNAKFYVSQSSRGFVMSGQGDVADGAAVIQGYDVSDVNGHVTFSTDDVVLKSVTGKINGQSVAVDGIIKTNTNTPVFDVAVKAPSVDIAAFSKELTVPVKGTVGFEGTVWGTMDDMQGRGSVTATDLMYTDVAIDNAKADVSYVDHVLTVETLTANTAGGVINASGAYNVNSGDYSVTGTVDHVALEQIPSMPAAVMGSVSADFAVYGNSNDMHSLTASGHVTGTDILYNGLMADSLSADVTYANELATVSNVTAAVAGGTLTGNGTYDTVHNNPDISFTASGISLDILQPYAGVPLSGTMDAAGHVTGSELAWDIAFNARNGSVNGMGFESIDGSAAGVGNQISIPAVTWRSGEGYHLLSGTLNLNTRMIDLRVQTNRIRIEELLPVIGKENLPFTGWADNDIRITGSLDNLQAQGQFHLTNGSYSGYLYKNISAEYRLDNDTVYITNGDISSYNASLAVQGSIGKNLDLQIDGKDLDIARMMPWNKTPRQGLVQLQAHLGGTMENPTASGSLRAPYLTINHMSLGDVRGDFGYGGNVLQLTGLHFTQHNGSYDGTFIYNTDTGWMNGRADVQRGDLASLLKLADVPLQKIEGEINGTVTLRGSSGNPAITLKGELANASLAGKAVDTTPLDVTFEDGTAHVNALKLQTGDSILAADGVYALHGPVKMELAAKNFPAQVLLDMIGEDTIAVDAPIDFAAELGGTGDAIEANVSAQVNGGTVNDISFTNAYALMNIKDGIIYLNQASAVRDPYKVSASGTIPVDALYGSRTDKTMDVSIHLDNAGLDILAFLTPYVESAAGSIGGSLTLAGTLADPAIHGSITTQGGTVKIRDVSYPLEQVDGSIVFGGHDVVLNASGTMDKKGAKDPGTISLEGNASWQGWKLLSYKAAADLEHINIQNPYYKGALTGYAAVTDSNGMPKISGLASIENVILDIPLSFEESSAMPDMALDFTVALGDKVRLYNPALYDVTLNGTANFKGTTAHPQPSGRFEAARGMVHYLDTDFRLTKAKADFSTMDSFIPVMDIEGQTRVGQYMVQLTLRGSADNMNMILRSNPPLTRQQIVSLITLRNSGKQQSSLTEEDLDNLMGSGIRMTLNSLGITQEIERALSLDVLTVTNGSLDLNDKNADLSRNYYNIEMGKYLFNNFMLTAAFGLNHDDNRFGMQYDLGSKFSVNAWQSESSAFAGGLYRYTF